MMGLPLAFAAPAVLGALILLPAIWWLLRMTPPKPRLESFPPTRLLLEIMRKEETPSKSPWWLTALRLILATLVILALAGPVLRPIAEEAPGDGPLLLVVDNGWAAGERWETMLDTARRITGLAADQGRPVSLMATAEGPGQRLEPTEAAEILKRLEALSPRPFPADRAALVPVLGPVADAARFGGVTWLADGLGGPDADAFAAFLAERIDAPIQLYDDARQEIVGLKPPSAGADTLAVPVIRRDAGAASAGLLRALDLQGRPIGEAPFDFAAGTRTADAVFTLPAELRNEIVRLEVSGETTAGAVQLLDERFRRRTVGLLSGASADIAQPLLSPLYYISRAVQPFADIREPREPNAATAVPELIEGGVSLIAMADIGTLTPEVEETVSDWVEDGGTLVRFAGPRLAGAEDALTPVRLRTGGRTLGGSLSWETPQPLAPFPDGSPFAGLAVPEDVLVERQVLAEPDATLAERTWATLADGTPLVTAVPQGDGWLVLFHVTADTSWSNLPLSGAFVAMLQRIVAFSSAAAPTDAPAGNAAPLLPPYRLLDGFGRFAAPGPEAQPLSADETAAPASAARPPGLYGAEDGFRAVNLLDADAELVPFSPSVLSAVTARAYPSEAPQNLAPYLLAAALVLLILDALAVLWLAGALAARRPAAAALIALAALAAAVPPVPAQAQAQDGLPAGLSEADRFAMAAAMNTHLAYVVTGNETIDETSRAGLSGLSRILADRTALEPGEPIGVDVARDELAFFPLLYWPIDPEGPQPAPAAMARLDAFMKQGGSVIFDTRDQLQRATGAASFSGTPAAERLRSMLSSLDIPPLEPVPADHVLTKAFYLLNDFPGRYTGGPLWVEATPRDADLIDRPARPGDGVTTILITENDLAGAWAADADGSFLYPTVPADPLQREMALRTGVNIVMYTLTGNYKADQVHVPALLERLGQ